MSYDLMVFDASQGAPRSPGVHGLVQPADRVVSEALDVVRHLFLGEACIDQNEVFDYLTQRMGRPAAVDDAEVCDASVG